MLLFNALGPYAELEAVVPLRAGQATAASTLSRMPCARQTRDCPHSVQGREWSWRETGSQLTALQWQEDPRGILIGKDVLAQSWWATATSHKDEAHYIHSYGNAR